MLTRSYFFLEAHDIMLAALSFCICALLLATKQFVPILRGRIHDLGARQSMHKAITPRIGGVAVFVSLGVSIQFAPITISSNYAKFLAATSIIFLAGLLEDLGIYLSAKMRLLASIIASLLTIALLQVWLPRIGIPGLNDLLSHWAVGIPITVFITAGYANGFNLIDGLHGLSALTAIVATIAMFAISMTAGYDVMAHLTMMLGASLFGFFVFNYPFGKIFLGDAGAYTIGFVLAWFGIAMLLNIPNLSPWALFLVLFWPAADTIFAIFRRVSGKTHVFFADRLHAHHIVMRGLHILYFAGDKRHITNPLSTIILMPFIVTPSILGVLYWNDLQVSRLLAGGFLLLYFVTFAMAPRLICRHRRRRVNSRS